MKELQSLASVSMYFEYCFYSGPGGRDGILGHQGGVLRPPHPQAHPQHGFHQARQDARNDRVRMGPIVFDAEHLEYDDNDDYARDHETEYSRPRLGLDLSNLFTPIVNFMKFLGKSLESVFTLLEKQANLLLGKYYSIFYEAGLFVALFPARYGNVKSFLTSPCKLVPSGTS